MRTGFLTAVAIAAVAFSGVAHASSVLTETFTALITSGTDSVGAFGAAGANLAGDTVTFSFGYNTVLLQADVNAGTDGSFEYVYPSNYNEYVDEAGDSAVTETVTIDSQTFTIANTSSGYPNEGYVLGCTPVCSGGDGLFIVHAQIGSGASIQTSVYTTQDYSLSDNLFSQTGVNALFGGGVTTGDIQISDGFTEDVLALTDVSTGSATPEPTTWISLALSLGTVGLLKRRRSAR
jgi:hypothetical protein